uniref:Uncharacterized protein n=1 Tax=Panagrolaimus davidi TaxID=227884 RepID=A0A914QC01_9BILA
MGGAISTVAKATKSCFKAVGNVVTKAVKGVGNFIHKHGKKLLAGVAVLAGVALCFVPGFQVVGAGIICGGINAGMLSFNKNATWKDFGKAFLGGFAAGFITTLAAPAIAAMAAAAGGIATSTFAAAAISCTVSAAAYAGIGILTNGINNIIFEKKFFDNFKSSAICGGLIGFISPIINSAGINEAVVKFFKPLENKFGIALTTGAMASIGGRGLRMAANFCISAITQKIQTGKISWQRAAVDSVVYGYVNHKMAANAIEANAAQFCTIDQTVPYTYVPEKVKIVNTPPPPPLSQSQTNPSNSSNNIETVNSDGTASTSIPTRAPSTAVPPRIIRTPRSENISIPEVVPLTSTRETTNQQQLNETSLQTGMERDTVNGQPSDVRMQKVRSTSTLIESPTVSTTTIISDTIEHEPTTDNKILQSLSKLKTVNSNAAQSQCNRVSETQPLNNDNSVNPLYTSKKDDVESKAAVDMTSQTISQETTAKTGPSNDTKIESLNHERNSATQIQTSFLPSVQVGVQVASKISKSNKPTNPGIETINIECKENGMGLGQKLSMEKVVAPQLPSASKFQASKADQNLQQSYNLVGEKAAVKVVVTYPVISFIENEYKILDWKEWPQLPKDIKIVTVTGPHASGRTSFIHSLIYFWGYKLLKEQVITSKLRIGMHLNLF